jgi:hypothetical protein
MFGIKPTIMNTEHRTPNTLSRTLNKVLTLCTFATCLTVAMLATSCNKEDNAEVAPGVVQIDVTPRVRAFVDDALSASGSANRSSISTDSAKWYLEAGLNFALAQAWLECNEVAFDSLEVFIPSNGTELSGSEVNIAFNSLHSMLLEMITPEEEHLIVADVEFRTADGGYEANVFLQLGFGYDKTNQLITTFSNPLRFGNFSTGATSNCGCQNQSGDCADKQIASRINNALPGLTVGCYYTNVETKGVSWPYPNNFPNGNYTDFTTGIPATPYMVFTCNGSDLCVLGGGNCLSTSKLSFYTQQGWNLMNILKPIGKVSVSANFEDGNLLCSGNCYWSWHGAAFVYAVKNCTRQ